MGGLSALHLKTDGVLADKARWWLRVKAGRDALMAARAAIASLRHLILTVFVSDQTVVTARSYCPVSQRRAPGSGWRNFRQPRELSTLSRCCSLWPALSAFPARAPRSASAGAPRGGGLTTRRVVLAVPHSEHEYLPDPCTPSLTYLYVRTRIYE